MLNQIKNGIKNITSKMRPPKMAKPGQKSLEEREKKPGQKDLSASQASLQDEAYAPGKKKLRVENLSQKKAHGKSQPMDESAQNNLRPADIIKKNQRAQRRNGPIGRGNK